MDYRYYYETLEAAPARGLWRSARARNALIAGLAAEAVALCTHAVGIADASTVALACATTAGLALASEAPARRIMAGGRMLLRSLPFGSASRGARLSAA